MEVEAINGLKNSNEHCGEIADLSRDGGVGNRQSSDVTLKKVCQVFEGMLMGIILKQGLKTGLIEEDESKSSDALRDYAIEQAARELGRTETFGISRILYEQMKKGSDAQ